MEMNLEGLRKQGVMYARYGSGARFYLPGDGKRKLLVADTYTEIATEVLIEALAAQPENS